LARDGHSGPDYATRPFHLFAQAVCERDRPIPHDAAPAVTRLTSEARRPPTAIHPARLNLIQLLFTAHRAHRLPNAQVSRS